MDGKGSGKGYFHVNCNVAGLPRSSIDRLPRDGVAMFRESTDQAVEFCERLREAMAPFPYGGVHFDNIDISSVQWPHLPFSILLDVLQEKAATTARLKAFKCGLDDECINCVASWLEHLNPQNLPSEIHLSHNQISQRGLEVLLAALENKRRQLPAPANPVWLRVENNQVDISPSSAAMKSLLAMGRVVFATRIGDRRPSTAAVAMPDFKNAWAGQSQQQQQRAASQPVRMALPQGAAAWPGAVGAGWTAQAFRPAAAAWSPWVSSVGGAQTVRPAAGAKPVGSAQRAPQASDRSRTPARRQEPQLPPNWEKQWSDEYQIPYYWNNVTGESLWEPPE